MPCWYIHCTVPYFRGKDYTGKHVPGLILTGGTKTRRTATEALPKKREGRNKNQVETGTENVEKPRRRATPCNTDTLKSEKGEKEGGLAETRSFTAHDSDGL